jgi:hypothetical protein
MRAAHVVHNIACLAAACYLITTGNEWWSLAPFAFILWEKSKKGGA